MNGKMRGDHYKFFQTLFVHFGQFFFLNSIFTLFEYLYINLATLCPYSIALVESLRTNWK